MSTAKKKLTTCQPKTAVAYARYSSAQQRDVSIEQQLKDIHAYADREGYTIIHEYTDRAKSGFKHSDRRADFQAMLRDATAGAFDTVIAWKVDRFGRDRRESAMYKGQLADVGISVIYAMEPIPDGAAGCLTEGMLEAIAEWYSRNLSENVKRGKTDNAVKCLANNNGAYGYRLSADKHFVVQEDEASVVRKIFSLYEKGGKVGSIPRTLAEQGIYNPKGLPFTTTQIRYMLKNEAYIGVYKYSDVRIPGGVPAIIDQETWDTCQHIMKSMHRTRGPVADYILSGKCRCGLCGQNMIGCYATARNKSLLHYYACKGRRNTENRCKQKYINKDKIENKIFDLLFDNILNGKYLDQFAELVAESMKASAKESPVRELEEEYSDIIRRIENINIAISEGIWTDSTKSMLKSLTERSKEIEKAIAYQTFVSQNIVSKDRIKFYLHKVADGKRDDREFLRSIVVSFINSITFYDGFACVVINSVENVETIPPDELPPIGILKEVPRFDLWNNTLEYFSIVEPYPAIAFKIAI